MFELLIDTADEQYIEKKWAQIKEFVPKEKIMGVTTNPNAFFKVGDKTIKEWETRARKLCKLVSAIREDNLGLVHIQFPNSNMTESLFQKWIKLVSTFSDGNTRMAIKIPPFKNALEIIERNKRDTKINVTGVADVGTALFAASYDVDFVSIIPGRMEEAGIDAKSHISYAQQSKLKKIKIITGSMRTLDGLKWCVEHGTLPTIGTRVLDLINDSNAQEVFRWSKKNLNASPLCPSITNTNTQLSVDFFKQMDEMGTQAYLDLQTI
tara:strand:- start:1465 stop:2262 length:798 start_codon:yes stop_codon:yes gene_type:complete